MSVRTGKRVLPTHGLVSPAGGLSVGGSLPDVGVHLAQSPGRFLKSLRRSPMEAVVGALPLCIVWRGVWPEP
eukprot:scaffold280026_cov32-Tisochrysis_lutea.AAC.2